LASNKIILVGGGARSGKSRFALSLAERLGLRRLYLATAQAGDDEMRQRISKHQRERGAGFVTVEEPWAVCDVLKTHGEFEVVVFDCLTLWLSNLLLQTARVREVLDHVEELTAVLERRNQHVIVVTNEVGMGIVPETPLGREFRDLAGLAHQRLSDCADEVYFAVLGNVLRIKPACRCGGVGEAGA
jgi:adenosylcobinamide kinase / adenosylcobinamide-phosphate guanylyltransferase